MAEIDYHKELVKRLRDVKRAKRRAVADKRRFLYLGLANPAMSAITIGWGYFSSVQNVVLTALIMAVIKDTSIWTAIFKRVEAYWRENGVLSVALLELKTQCDAVTPTDKEAYDQANLQIKEYFTSLKKTYDIKSN